MIWHAWLCYWDPLRTSAWHYFLSVFHSLLFCILTGQSSFCCWPLHCSLWLFHCFLSAVLGPLSWDSGLVKSCFWYMPFRSIALCSFFSFLFTFLFPMICLETRGRLYFGIRVPTSISLQWGFCEPADFFYTLVCLSRRIAFISVLLQRWICLET